MKTNNNTTTRRVTLGKVSGSTLGGVRGTIELGGLYQAAIRLR